MAAPEAVEFLINDHGDKNPPSGFRQTFAEDKPYMSLLQRQNKTLDEMLKMFSWKEDNVKFLEEYDKEKNDIKNISVYRKRVDFCVCGWREIKEDFGRGDVSCLRDIRLPFVTSRTPLRAMKDEFNA